MISIRYKQVLNDFDLFKRFVKDSLSFLLSSRFVLLSALSSCWRLWWPASRLVRIDFESWSSSSSSWSSLFMLKMELTFSVELFTVSGIIVSQLLRRVLNFFFNHFVDLKCVCGCSRWRRRRWFNIIFCLLSLELFK